MDALNSPASKKIARAEVAAARRVVIKVGTRVLTHDDGHIALASLFAIVEALGTLRRGSREVILVTSGAVGLGAEALGMQEVPVDLHLRQACAAVGQSRLMALYQEGFSHLRLVCGQVLLTQSDFQDRGRYLNLRATLSELLTLGVIPVVNENDAVSTEELAILGDDDRRAFGDNDQLSALVATKLGADLLVLLTDVEGVYDRDPRTNPDARLLTRLTDPASVGLAGSSQGSRASRGGMRSKIQAALLAARSGCHVVIASGRKPRVLARVLEGAEVGTYVPAARELNARETWIARAAGSRGTLVLDAGAVEAVRQRGASLLVAGVTRIEGEFAAGDVVELRSQEGTLLGRGVVHCDAEAARAWRQGTAPEGLRNHHALVHRDSLVLEPA